MTLTEYQRQIGFQFATEMKALRLKRGLTLTDVARRCEMPLYTIRRLENGTIDASLDMLVAVARALDATITLDMKSTQVANP